MKNFTKFFREIPLWIFLMCILNACSVNQLDTEKCKEFKKTSSEYVLCVNELVSETNTIKNLKEFKKHKTLKSFFKQVEIIKSE